MGSPGRGENGCPHPTPSLEGAQPPQNGLVQSLPHAQGKISLTSPELGLLWGMGKGEAEQSCALHPSALATSSWGGSLNTAGAVPPPHPKLWGCLGPRHPPQTPKLPRAAWGSSPELS